MNKNKFDTQYDILKMPDPGVKLTPNWWKANKYVHCYMYVIPT